MFRPGGRFAKKAAVADTGPTDEKATAAWLIRLQKDFTDLDIPSNVKIIRNQENLAMFSCIINPTMGYWKGGLFEFKFNIFSGYPHEDPKVICLDRIWHPNIDLEGGVCVSVLRPWKPVYSIQVIIFALLHLFYEPNPNSPLNEDAAKQMRDDLVVFGEQVTKSLNGKLTVITHDGRTITFPRNKGFSVTL